MFAARIRDVAVCISGAPRHSDQLISSDVKNWPPGIAGLLKQTPFELQKELFDRLDKDGYNWTLADTVHEFLFPSLGEFDVYMYVPTPSDGRHGREYAEAACRFFTPRNTSHRLFCGGGADQKIGPSELGVSPDHFRQLDKQLQAPWLSYLQQLQGQAMCNTMIYEQERVEGARYLSIVRLRADSVFLAPVPSFVAPAWDDRSIFMMSRRDGCCGNEDIFNVGSAKIMHAFLDRVQDIRFINFTRGFIAEDYARFWIKHVYRGRLRELRGIRTHPWRWRPNVDGKEVPKPSIKAFPDRDLGSMFWRSPQVSSWLQAGGLD